MDIAEYVPLETLTTFKTGGAARFLLTVHSEAELPLALAFAREKSLPLIPIGDGSNILAADAGLEAVLVRLLLEGIESRIEGGRAILTAEAGVSWDALVAHAVERGWWGIENLSAIPGTVGAAAVQNIGAYGAALSESVVSVDVFDTKRDEMRTLPSEECAFGYRTSIFKKETDRYIVVRVTLSLSTVPFPKLAYRDLAREFKDVPAPSLAAVREAVMRIREGKFPPLSEFGTAGSFFLNPILEGGVTAELMKKYPDIPLFPLPEGGVKIPLAWIFDHALSLKEEKVGKAFLWHKQPLVITADAGATSADVIALASRIARAVFRETGIEITPEVRLLGAEKGIVSAEK